jgi:protein-arginine kinase activator protein McsA
MYMATPPVEMQAATRELEFEKAASMRDELRQLKAARLAL